MSKILSLIFISLFLFSCGKNSNSVSSVGREEQQEELKGNYKAVLRPINSSISGWIPYGNAEISVSDEDLSIVTYLDDDQRVPHLQSIHEGNRCPTLSDDKNNDSVIDAIEAEAVVGKVLMPLDGDLTSQKKGEKNYPMGSSFTYQRKAKLDDILADLYLVDENPNDSIGKLTMNQPFNLSGKVVLIHGTAASSKVPSSVQAHGNIAPHLSVPVVCGLINRID